MFASCLPLAHCGMNYPHYRVASTVATSMQQDCQKRFSGSKTRKPVCRWLLSARSGCCSPHGNISRHRRLITPPSQLPLQYPNGSSRVHLRKQHPVPIEVVTDIACHLLHRSSYNPPEERASIVRATNEQFGSLVAFWIRVKAHHERQSLPVPRELHP